MVLVTGAAGFVGGHLIRGLLEAGYRVRALVRHGEKADNLKKPGVDIFTGDMTDPDSLNKAAIGTETVINLVGIISGSEKIYKAVHTEGTRILCSAARAAGARKFIYVSANGASRTGSTAYFRTKWEAEEATRSSGLDYTILRPSVLYGPGDAFVNQLVFGMKIVPVFPIFGSGEYKFQPLYIGDLVKCIIRSISEHAASSQTIDVGGPEALTFNQIVDSVATVIDRRVFKIHIPMPIVKSGARIMGSFLSRPPVSVDQLAMMTEGNTCDISRMKEVFRIDPVIFMDGIKTYI